MDVPTRDVVATSMVAAAAVAYALWEADAAPTGLDDVRATGLVVLALGFAASAVAVVPGFDELLRGSRAYLLGSAAVGLVALGGGVWALLGPSASGLRLLMGAGACCRAHR